MALQIEVENKKFDFFKNEFISAQYISLYEWYGIKEKFREQENKLELNYKGGFALSDTLKLEFECIEKKESYVNFTKLPFKYTVEYVIKATVTAQKSIKTPLSISKSKESSKIVSKNEFSLKSYASNNRKAITNDTPDRKAVSSEHLKAPTRKLEKTFKASNDELLNFDMAIRAMKPGKPKANSDPKKILPKSKDVQKVSSAVVSNYTEVGSVSSINKIMNVDDVILNQEFEKAKQLESYRELRKNKLTNLQELLCVGISNDELDK